jgi:hypothetical protein
MYTSLACVALTTSLLASSPSESVTWQNDYVAARAIAQTSKKPLAVFIGNGATGFDKVCREGSLSPELQKMLEDNYVCIYADVSTPAGQKLASDLAVTRGMGLVLSDRAGEKQAFYHDGDLSTADMSRWVKQFADPNVAVATTMTNTSGRISMYPSSGMTMSNGYVMYGAYPGSYSGGMVYMGGGCPGGNCYRR